MFSGADWSATIGGKNASCSPGRGGGASRNGTISPGRGGGRHAPAATGSAVNEGLERGIFAPRMTPLQAERLEGVEGVKEAQTAIGAAGCRYFFFAGALAAVVFGAVAQDTPAAGEGTFLGCLGFFASRLPRN
jgi:hypothetical protein